MNVHCAGQIYCNHVLSHHIVSNKPELPSWDSSMTLAHARNLRFRALALVMVGLLAATLVVD